MRSTNSPFLIVATSVDFSLGSLLRFVVSFAVTLPEEATKPSFTTVFSVFISVVKRLVFAYTVCPLYESLVQPLGLTAMRSTNSPFLIVATSVEFSLGSLLRFVVSFAVTFPEEAVKPSLAVTVSLSGDL